MHEYKHYLILPTLYAVLPCPSSQEIVCIGGGRTPAKSWLTQIVQKSEKDGTVRPIWAIDRGVNICQALSLPPAHLIGDGDSADRTAWTWAEKHGARVHAFPPAKDFTDTELALKIAAELMPCALVILTGAFGGRFDHLTSAASVAAHAALPCILADEREALFFLHGDESLTITCDSPPQAISLLPFTEECTGITTNGLRWELNGSQLHSHSSTTISNVLAVGNTEHRFSVALRRGILGVYLCHKE